MYSSKRQQEFIDEFKRTRGLEFARLGMKIEVNGDPGIIVGLNSRANLDVVFTDSKKYGKSKRNVHPTWETVYFDVTGEIVADYRK